MSQHQERTNISEVKCRDEAQRWRTENIGLLQLHLLAALWKTLTKNISDFKNILLYFYHQTRFALQDSKKTRTEAV